MRNGDFFGEPWSSGICKSGSRQPTPVGEQCVLCDEDIAADDQGVFVWAWTDATAGPEVRAQHRECALRDAVGGIGHFTDHRLWCLNMRDPDAGLGYRESARRVWDHVNRIGRGKRGNK